MGMLRRLRGTSRAGAPRRSAAPGKVAVLGLSACLVASTWVFLGSATAEAATSCSSWKAASWGQGWTCYTYDSSYRRLRAYGQLEDTLTDGYCISFAMRSANAIRDQLNDGYYYRHHNVACTNFKPVSFNYDISGLDLPMTVTWDAVAVATREKSSGYVVNYLTIDTATCSPQCQ